MKEYLLPIAKEYNVNPTETNEGAFPYLRPVMSKSRIVGYINPKDRNERI